MASPLFSLMDVSFVVFLSFFLKELGPFPASWLWFLFVVSPLPYRFVVTRSAELDADAESVAT